MIDKEAREAIVAYRLEKAHKTLEEIPIHIEHQLWNTAVNRLYYACFYAVNALLISRQIETKSHSGALRMLSLHFTKTQKLSIELNRFYADLFENRQSGDYTDFTYFDREMVEELYEQAIEFVEAIENLIETNQNCNEK
jgi:uncharacterized protein (UPF0332 family)